MKTIKIFLITVSILLILALLFGVYVWYSLQKLNSQTQGYKEVQQQESTASESEAQNQNVSEISGSDVPATEEVIEINTADLSDSQQKALDTFGIEGDTITITEGMISCAKNAVGGARYEEILGGAAPSPLESMKLIPCMNR